MDGGPQLGLEPNDNSATKSSQESIFKQGIRTTIIFVDDIQKECQRLKKLGAILGDEVRTGINVSVFPGVKIGRGAWLGPGAIVEKDIASGARVRAS